MYQVRICIIFNQSSVTTFQIFLLLQYQTVLEQPTNASGTTTR